MTDADGGSAFPTTEKRDKEGFVYLPSSNGMSLRDYFAARAMQALIAGHLRDTPGLLAYDDVADVAYSIADSMLEARDA